MTPAATVSGATPARMKNSTAGTPSRSRASARDTLPGLLLGAAWVRDICLLLVLGGSDWMGGRDSHAVGQHGAVHRGLGLGDELAQAGVEQPGQFVEAAA